MNLKSGPEFYSHSTQPIYTHLPPASGQSWGFAEMPTSRAPGGVEEYGKEAELEGKRMVRVTFNHNRKAVGIDANTQPCQPWSTFFPSPPQHCPVGSAAPCSPSSALCKE